MSKDLVRLTEKFTSPGVFWNAQDNAQFSATLSYDPDGRIELHAAPRLTGLEEFGTFSEMEVPVLFGVLSDGTPCNCFGVSMISNTTTFKQESFAVSTPIFHCHMALIGEAVSLDAEPKIDSLEIMSDSLTLMTGLPRIIHENREGNVMLQFPNASEPVLEVDTGEALFRIKFGRRMSIGFFGHAEGAYEPIIDLAYKESKNLISYLDDLVPRVVGLLTLLAGDHAAPSGIRVVNKSPTDGRKSKTAYLLFNYTHDFPEGKPNRDQICTVAALGVHSSKFINSWFTSDDQSHRVFNLFLGTLYTNAYVETHFLSLAQAIESFHRVFYGAKVMPDDIFEQLKSALGRALETVPLPEGLVDKLANGFQFLNEQNFQTRIETLIGTLETESRNMLIGADEDQFIRTLKQTRNYLTHPGIKKKSAVLSKPVDYLNFNRRMQALLRLLILRQLGLPEENALKVVSVGVREIFREA